MASEQFYFKNKSSFFWWKYIRCKFVRLSMCSQFRQWSGVAIRWLFRGSSYRWQICPWLLSDRCWRCVDVSWPFNGFVRGSSACRWNRMFFGKINQTFSNSKKNSWRYFSLSSDEFAHLRFIFLLYMMTAYHVNTVDDWSIMIPGGPGGPGGPAI